MKQYIGEFFRRGSVACGFGPLILAVLYLILQKQTGLETLTVDQVCLGILSLSALAFLAGGLNVLYQIERLPLAVAIFLHGGALYGGYLVTYLLNGWLERGLTPILLFTGIFALGYLAIWAVIYSVTKKKTEQINAVLKQKQQSSGEETNTDK